MRIDSKNTYYLFNYNKSPYEWDNFTDNVKEIVLRLPQRFRLKNLWENILAPLMIRKLGIDLWFSPDFSIPKFLRIPSIVTIHDLIFKNFYTERDNKFATQLSKRANHAIRNASMIIVDSEAIFKEVEKEYTVDAKKIVVIPAAADEHFHRIHEPSLISNVLKRYKIDYKYILFTGETSERKNLIRLIHAYNFLRKNNKIDGRKLLIVGKRTTNTHKILSEVQRLELSSDVIFTGYIPDEDLPFIYNSADLFVFPSLYEGFGIPPLEAMQCETPVAASHITSIPEVVGDGAMLFDPYDESDIAEKIDQIINKKVNVDELVKRAQLQAKNFSWDNSANKYIEIFGKLSRST